MDRFIALISAISLAFIGGCYTKFATFEPRNLPAEQVTTIVDSTGKTVRVVARADSMKTTERKICVWERDLMGFPYLHCYRSYYPKEWYLYTYSPWWYFNNDHVYNGDRCPPYYYYDRNCGCCRYYLNDPNRSNPTIDRSGNRGTPATSGPRLLLRERDNPAVTSPAVPASIHKVPSASPGNGQASQNGGGSPKTSTAAEGGTPVDSSKAVSPDTTTINKSKPADSTPPPPSKPKSLRRSIRGR